METPLDSLAQVLNDYYKQRGVTTTLCDCGASLCFSPNGKMLASASDDGALRFWNIKAACRPAPVTVGPVTGTPTARPVTGTPTASPVGSTKAPYRSHIID
jgi:WD40 repeat protein